MEGTLWGGPFTCLFGIENGYFLYIQNFVFRLLDQMNFAGLCCNKMNVQCNYNKLGYRPFHMYSYLRLSGLPFIGSTTQSLIDLPFLVSTTQSLS